MSPALASHHARVAGDDRAPELLVVGHAAIVERWGPPCVALSMPALGGLERGVAFSCGSTRSLDG
jgi:hypothetical protein